MLTQSWFSWHRCRKDRRQRQQRKALLGKTAWRVGPFFGWGDRLEYLVPRHHITVDTCGAREAFAWMQSERLLSVSLTDEICAACPNSFFAHFRERAGRRLKLRVRSEREEVYAKWALICQSLDRRSHSNPANYRNLAVFDFDKWLT